MEDTSDTTRTTERAGAVHLIIGDSLFRVHKESGRTGYSCLEFLGCTEASNVGFTGDP